MTSTGPVAIVLSALDVRGRRLAFAFGAVHLADRLALFAVALTAPRDDRTSVIVAGVALGVLTLLRAFASSLATAHAQATLHVRVGAALLERDLLKPSALEDDDPEAALLDGIDIGARIAGAVLPSTIADVLGAVIVGVLLTQVAPPALLLAFGVAVAGGALVLAVSRRVTVTESERAWAAHRPILDRLVAILGGRLEIVGNGADEAMRRELALAARAWERSMGRFERASALAGRLPLLFGAGLLAAVLLLRSSLPARDLALSAVMLAASLPPFAGAARGLHDLTKLAVRVTPLASLLASLRKRASLTSPMAPSSAAAPISTPFERPRTLMLDAATFRYAGARTDVLKSATCTLTRGTVTLLVGPNGCGKSTLLKMLLAIEPPREGKLVVDGAVLDDLEQGTSLRARVAYLPQRPYLSDRVTVREAFALLAPEFEDAAAMKWIERIGMLEVLSHKQPDDPLSTRIGRLSAGQRQRLAIARVGVLDRPVWLLDEPDASLDAEGLSRLERIVDEERATRIIVIAAHAEALLRIADRVLRIAGGEVTDEPRPSGTFP